MPETPYDSYMKNATSHDSLKNMQQYVDQHRDNPSAVNEVHQFVCAALIWAAKNGNSTTLEALLEFPGINLNTTDSSGMTPLMQAAANGHANVIKMLLAAGADVTAIDQYGRTALIWATANNHTAAIQVLNPESKQQHYNKQIIIDFSDDEEGGYLKSKWNLRHLEGPFCETMSGKAFLQNPTHIKLNADDVARIYIIGHGSVGQLYLDSPQVGGFQLVGFDRLAEKLAEMIGNHNVVINLIACSAGKGSDEVIDKKSGDSFAAHLQEELSTKLNRNIPVVARTQTVAMSQGLKATYDLNYTERENPPLDRSKPFTPDLKRKQPGSKVVFTADQEGNQLKLDAYSYLWKDKMINAIQGAIKQTTGKQRELLEDWEFRFAALTPKEIFDIVSVELLNKPNSILKANSSSKLFYSKTHEKLLALIQSGHQLFISSHTALQPEATGRNINPKK